MSIKKFCSKIKLFSPGNFRTFLSVNFTKGIGHEQSSLEDAHHHLMSGVRKNNVAIAHYTLCIILRVGEWVLKVVGVFTLHQTVCNSKVISHLFRICKKTEEYYIWCRGRRRGPNLSFFVGIFYLIIKGHNGMYSKWLNFSLFRPQVWHVPT